jgi:hypothetical protein
MESAEWRRCILRRTAQIERASTRIAKSVRHVPAPRAVAILLVDEGNTIALAGGPGLRLTTGRRHTRAGSAGLYKLVLLDIGALSVGYLLGKGVDPVDLDDLEPAERERLAGALDTALRELREE